VKARLRKSTDKKWAPLEPQCDHSDAQKAPKHSVQNSNFYQSWGPTEISQQDHQRKIGCPCTAVAQRHPKCRESFPDTPIQIHSPHRDAPPQFHPICPYVSGPEEEGYHKSSRTRDESQRIAGQAYSRAYNTPFKSSRLQGIPIGHTVPFHSSATNPARFQTGPHSAPKP
jgi:hypothetical protein